MRQFFKGFFVGIGFLLFFIFGLVITKAFEIFIVSEKMTISRDVEVSKSIKYDEFMSYPRFNASSTLSTKESLSLDDKAEIDRVFNEILAEVKKADLCSGGSYSLEPNYSYKDGVLAQTGYRFNANFECTFKEENAKTYQNMLNAIDAKLKDSDLITMSIPSIRPTISDEKLASIQNELYDMVLDEAKKVASEYSTKLKRECDIKAINYDMGGYYPKAIHADTAYNMPIIKDKIQKLKANISYECK